MTQHFMTQDTQEDIRTMKNLRNFVGLFMAFSVLLAVGVTLFAP